MIVNKEIPQDATNILGLTKYDRKILEAISGVAKQISTISRITKLPRTSLLYRLRGLEKRKLVMPVKNGKFTHWKSKLPLLLPKILNQGVTVLKGKNELFSVFEKIVELPRNSRVYGIQPDKSIVQAINKNSLEELLKINKVIKDKKLIFEGIVHEKSVDTLISELGKQKAGVIFDSFIGRLEDYAKIPDDFANVESEIYIFNGSAYILNWSKEIGLEIHDPSMVSLLLAMFSCVKELGQRYSQNQKMSNRLTSPRTAPPTPPLTPPNTLQ